MEKAYFAMVMGLELTLKSIRQIIKSIKGGIINITHKMPNQRKIRVCGHCGKAPTNHWRQHWNTHPLEKMVELKPGEVPISAFKENWLELIEPKSLRDEFLTAAK